MGALILTLTFRKCSETFPEMFREMFLFLTLVPEQACSRNVPEACSRNVPRRAAPGTCS